MKKRGFTLIELMVVISVIGLLTAIALPRFSGITKNAKLAQIQANTKNIRTAVAMWEAKNGHSHINRTNGVSSDIFNDWGQQVKLDESFKEFWNKDVLPALPGTDRNSYSLAPNGRTSQLNVYLNDPELKIPGWIINVEDGQIYPAVREDEYGIKWNEF